MITGGFPNYSVIVRGMSSLNAGNTPLFLLDNMPVDLDLITTLNVNDIAFVDLLTGASAAIYGSQGANAVIAYFTRTGGPTWTNNREDWGIMTFPLKGFYTPSEFYSPNYDTRLPEHVKPDWRPTLFWEPEIILNGDDKTLLEFYSSDETGDYRITIEGILRDGTPLFHQSVIRVR